MAMGRGTWIAGTGMAVPPRVLSSAELGARLGLTEEWIVERTGVRERRVAEGDCRPFDLAVRAANGALKDAGVPADALDMVICASMTSEMSCPATACRVADAIGARGAGAFDLSAACSGMVIGMNLADNGIRTGAFRHVLVVAADVLSEIVNWDDRKVAPLFGDGAAAMVLSAIDDETRGCLYQKMGSDGSRWTGVYVPRRESDLPPGANKSVVAMDRLHMDGAAIFRFAISTMPALLREAMSAAGVTASDLRVVFLHQSNLRILDKVREEMGFTKDQIPITIDRFGNTSAASIGMCLHEARKAGRAGAGDTVLFGAIGGGLTWATNVWRM